MNTDDTNEQQLGGTTPTPNDAHGEQVGGDKHLSTCNPLEAGTPGIPGKPEGLTKKGLPRKAIGRPVGAKSKGPQRYAASICWEKAKLDYKLKPAQKVIYDTLKGFTGRKGVLHCSRRFGKSYLLLLIAVEEALKKENTQISFICPTQRNLKTYIKPIFDTLLRDCPDELRPKYKVLDGCYSFPNGSSIYLFGVEGGNMENLRGQSAGLAIVDEAGFVSQLSYIVESILLPQLFTTNGKMILSSSSPVSPAHEFVKYINDAIINSYYFKFTIEEAGYEPKLVEEFIKEMGGRESPQCRRELFCEIVRDGERSLCPEWDDKFIISEAPRDELFAFYHKVFSLDSGVRDATVGLFGYYDFKKANLIIEDEFVLSGIDVRTDKIAEQIQAKEAALGYSDVSRYADNENLILIQDLSMYHGTPVLSTSKDSLEAMVNMVRLWVKDGRIKVKDNCKLLLQTLRNGEWNTNKTEFSRTEELFHMDAFASLMYMVRMCNTAINPVPPTFINGQYLDPHTTYIQPREKPNAEWLRFLNLDKKEEDDY